MIRRAPVFAVLAAVALMLGASLSLALARPTHSILLTPTIVPIFDQAAYMPLLKKNGAPAPTGSPTATSTAMPSTSHGHQHRRRDHPLGRLELGSGL